MLDSQQRLGGRRRWPREREKLGRNLPPRSPRGATRDHQPVWPAQHSSNPHCSRRTSHSSRLHKALHHMLSNNFHLIYIAFYCISLNKMLHHMLLPPSIASACIGFAPLIASTCIANHPILPPSGVSNQHNAMQRTLNFHKQPVSLTWLLVRLANPLV